MGRGRRPTGARDRPPDPGRCGGASSGWTVALHRPPPAPAPLPVPAVRLPAAASPPPAPPSPAGAAIVVTLAGGAVVSLLLHQPTFLVLSSIGAIGTLATALWPRLRRRAQRRADGSGRVPRRCAVAAEVASHQAAVAARLRAEALELPAAVACAMQAGPQLWARRTDDPDAFAAVVGRGDRWQPPALEASSDRVPEEWWAVVEAAGSAARRSGRRRSRSRRGRGRGRATRHRPTAGPQPGPAAGRRPRPGRPARGRRHRGGLAGAGLAALAAPRPRSGLG